MNRRRRAAAGSVLALLASTLMARAQTPAEAAKADKLDGRGGCFYLSQAQGDHALGDQSVIFRVNVSDFYRLDFAQRCQELSYPEPRLIITPYAGQGLICHAIDIDVRVGDQGPGSISEPCIPSALYKLTPAEVAAIPKKDIP